MGVKVTIVGKVFLSKENVAEFMEDVKKTVHERASRVIESVSKEMTTDVRKRFTSEGHSFSLSRDYLIRKRKQGWDERVGIRSKELVNSIKFYKNKPFMSDQFFVGTRKRSPSVKSRKGLSKNIDVQQYAKWLEYGTSKQPARPIFWLSLIKFVPVYRYRLKINLIDAIEKLIDKWNSFTVRLSDARAGF